MRTENFTLILFFVPIAHFSPKAGVFTDHTVISTAAS